MGIGDWKHDFSAQILDMFYLIPSISLLLEIELTEGIDWGWVMVRDQFPNKSLFARN